MRSVMESSPVLERLIPDWKAVHSLCRVDGPCVSVYLGSYAPATGSISPAERIRRALPELAEQLLARRLSVSMAGILLEPLSDLAAHADSGKGRSESTALFCSVHGVTRFTVPWVLEDLLAVEGRFLVRPLWESMRRNRRLFVLLLARNGVRVLECHGIQVREVPLPIGFPRSLEKFGDFDQPDHLLRNRSSAGPGVGDMRGVAFGTGAGHDKDYRRLHDFHRAVQTALYPLLPEPRCPLVLAGTEPDIASYARVNNYKPTVGDVVLGSTDDGTSDAVLASLARQAALDSLGDEEGRALQRYERAGLARKTAELVQIVRAAAEGRILDLFVTAGTAPEYGDLDEILGRAAEPGRFASHREELINAAVVETVRHHGHVSVLSPEQMPDNTAVAAMLRF